MRETVRLAAEYERKHSGRIEVLERKHAALVEEVALVERETAEMTAQLKRLTGGEEPAAHANDAAAEPARPPTCPSSTRFAEPRSVRRATPMRMPDWRN